MRPWHVLRQRGVSSSQAAAHVHGVSAGRILPKCAD
jgi:hypothetical protein